MTTARLNVWITELGDPCHIVQPNTIGDDPERWFVHVLDCDGKPLVWCGRRFINIEAKCGHADIVVPPGCYSVLASHTFVKDPSHGFGNRLTHVAVVRVNCGDHACVTLFSPSASHCGTWFAKAIAGYAEVGALDPALVRRATEAIDAVLTEMPEDPFTQATLELENQHNQAYVFEADDE